MSDEKDRLGDKFKDVEAARENQWAREQDAKLLEKMRQRLHSMVCPHCGQTLVEKTEGGIHMRVCPKGEGAWLEPQVLKTLIKA